MENTPTQPTTTIPSPAQPVLPTAPVSSPTQAVPPVASPQISQPVMPQQPVQPPVNNKKSNVPLILGMLVLLLLVAGSAYYLGMQNGRSTSDTTVIDLSDTVSPQTNSEDTLTEAPVVTEIPVASELIQYSNTAFNYNISYPTGWKVTTEDYNIPADPMTQKVFIFNPTDKPEENAFSGLIIEYVGMVQLDMSTAEKVVINGTSMFTSPSPHGTEYFVNIPDTDQFIKISGAEGNTANEETNLGLRAAFATFQFVSRF